MKNNKKHEEQEEHEEQEQKEEEEQQEQEEDEKIIEYDSDYEWKNLENPEHFYKYFEENPQLIIEFMEFQK